VATPLQTPAPGASGSISLVATLAGPGSRSATLTIAHDAAGGSATVALTGQGIAPVVKVLGFHQCVQPSSPLRTSRTDSPWLSSGR